MINQNYAKIASEAVKEHQVRWRILDYLAFWDTDFDGFDWAPEPVITHTGSNTMNLAVAMFWPGTDFGFVMMTNIAGTAADEALRNLAVILYKDLSVKPTQSGASVWPRNQGRKHNGVDTALERSRVARCSVFAPHQRSGKERQQD
jgi:hypothetical protein